MQDITATIDHCLEEVLQQELSKKIAEELDASILIDMFKLQGWHLVELNTLGNRKRSIDIKKWVEENIQGNKYNYGRRFVFEDGKDAVLFAMRWA